MGGGKNRFRRELSLLFRGLVLSALTAAAISLRDSERAPPTTSEKSYQGKNIVRGHGIQVRHCHEPTLTVPLSLEGGKRHLRSPPEPKRTSSDLVTRPEKAARSSFAEQIDLSPEKVRSFPPSRRLLERQKYFKMRLCRIAAVPPARSHSLLSPRVRWNEQLQCENKNFFPRQIIYETYD